MRRGVQAVAALGALIATAAGAQAFAGHDSSAPVDFAADRIEVLGRADRAVLTGSVVAQQANLTLTADRVTVSYTNASGIDVKRLDATGGVTVKRQGEAARGETAIYDLDRRIITLVGGVQLTRGTDVLRGGRLLIDLASGRSVMEGSATRQTDDTGAAIGRTGGRVTGRFTVPQRTGG